MSFQGRDQFRSQKFAVTIIAVATFTAGVILTLLLVAFGLPGLLEANANWVVTVFALVFVVCVGVVGRYLVMFPWVVRPDVHE